jgi:CheY-like chemotaxis protein
LSRSRDTVRKRIGAARESGFDQHLTKPVDADALQAFVSGASTG